MTESVQVYVGNTPSGNAININAAMANRHGLIAGATGTGKTVTLQALAQGFSKLGVPVFTADVKSDLAGISKKGEPISKILDRIKLLNREEVYSPAACPTVFWDLYGERGHPIRTTISEMGPLILGRLLDLNDVAQGVLEIAFRLADDQGLLLLDMKDLRSLLTTMADHASELTTTYGNVSKTTVGALQRKLASLDDAGAAKFFGEPAIDLKDFFKTDNHGQGYINVLDATKLLADQRLYSTFLLWLLSELFEKLDEVGDRDRPSSSSFSTRPIYSLRTRQNRWSTKSSRSCVSSARKELAFISSRKARSIFRTLCWASLVTGSSTRCARLRRAIRPR